MCQNIVPLFTGGSLSDASYRQVFSFHSQDDSAWFARSLVENHPEWIDFLLKEPYEIETNSHSLIPATYTLTSTHTLSHTPYSKPCFVP